MPTSTADVALAALRRKSFVGMTNKYAPWRSQQDDVTIEVGNSLGMLDVAVTAGVYNALYVQNALERSRQYQTYVRFFKGQHWTSPYEDGERKPLTNFCKTVVYKKTGFFVASGFKFKAVEGNEEVAKAFESVWNKNGGTELFRSVALECSMLGDSYLIFFVDSKDSEGNELPREKWSIGIKQLTSLCVFPEFDKRDSRRMTKCVVQYPVGVNNGQTVFETIIYWPDKIRTYADSGDEKTFTEVPNVFGEVPVVHVKNMINPASEFGISDLSGITELNEEYNSVKLAIKRILAYHAEPTTVIFGARASKLEKGAKKVWSNLPVDAKVQNLAFDSDLESSYKYLAQLRNEIMEESGLPEVAFQTNNPISNTSGVALRILYAPLYESKEQKQGCFANAFTRVVELILKGFEIIGVDVAELADDPAKLKEIHLEFSDALPKDMSAELDADLKKLAAKITSMGALVRKYNVGENLGRLSAEIIADQVAALAVKKEEAIALAQQDPNLTAPFLSSVAINEELEQMLSEVAKVKPDTEDNNEDTTEE